MPLDVTWTWTILMIDGKVYHVDQSITIEALLICYQRDGFHLSQIEAIIRH